jgi:GT2 family glycosyltransferase
MKNRKSFPLVSIVTLNYNQAAVTCEFLESCRLLTYPNYEILVCDMNSDESPASLIQGGNFPNTTLYLSETNKGFAGGNNWGMEFAKGDYIFIVNNDTEVTSNLIELLLAPFELDPQTGVVCPKIKYFSDPSIIQYAGFTRMSPYTGRSKTVGNRQEDRGQFDVIQTTWGPHGAAMMVKKEVIQKVGRFPEKFFLYYEEWDWGTRILNAGYKIYFQGLATIYHKESLSVGKLNPMKEYYLTRNRILYMRRNSGKGKLLIFSAFFTFFTLPKTVIKYLVKGNIPFLKAFLKGVRDNISISPYSPV